MKLTLRFLKSLGACESQVELFRSRFGTGVEVTKELVDQCAKDFDLGWFVYHDKFYAIRQTEAYDAIHFQAWNAYYAIDLQAWEAYKAKERRALEACDDTIGQAKEAYEATMCQAKEAYEATCFWSLWQMWEKEKGK